MLAADVAAGWGNFFASFFVPGEKVQIDPRILNVGDATLTGRVTLNVYLTTDGDIGNAGNPVASFNNLQVTIAPGQGLTKRTAFTLPNTLEAGAYILVAEVVPSGGVSNPDTSNDTAELTGLAVEWRFGFFGNRQNVVLTLLDADGTTTRFSAKNAAGHITEAFGGGLALAIQSSQAGASVSVTSKGPSGNDKFFDIASLTISGDIGKVDMPGVRLIGDGSILNSIRSLTLADVVGPGELDIFPGTFTPELRFGVVSDMVIHSQVGIKLLSVECLRNLNDTDDEFLSAPFIVKAVSGCNWQTTMELTGTSGGKSLGSLTYAGSIEGEYWRLAGGTGAISGGSILDININVNGPISSLSTVGNINGATIAATRLDTLRVGFDILNSRLLLGANLGFNNELDDPPGTVDDSFGASRLKSLTVGRDVIDSLIAVGVNPNAGSYLDGAATVVGTSSIDKITIAGAITNSRFMSGRIVSSAKVGGVNTPTLRDLRFQLPDFSDPTAHALPGTAAAAPFRFFIVYSDNVSLDSETIRTTDLTVTGPAGTLSALFISGTITEEGTIEAQYALTPPGGAWDPAENGLYTISVDDAIADLAGNQLPAGDLGQFEVRVTQGAAAAVDPASQGTHGQSVVDNAGALHTTFIEDGKVFVRIQEADGTLTVQDVSPGSGFLRSAVVLLNDQVTTTIIAATEHAVVRFVYDGSNWNGEILADLSPPPGQGITAISAAVEASDTLQVAYVLGAATASPSSGASASIWRLVQTAPGQNAGVSLIADLTSLTHVGTLEPGVRSFQIAIDAQNKTHVIFTPQFSNGNAGGNPTRPRSTLFYTSNVGGVAFAAPVVVSNVLPNRLSGDAGVGASLAINPQDNSPYIASNYLDRDNSGIVTRSSLLFHRQVGVVWTTQTVTSKSVGYKGSSDRGTGATPQLQFDAGGRASIAFSDYAIVKVGQVNVARLGQIRLATLSGSTWSVGTVYAQSNPLLNGIEGLSMSARNGKRYFTAEVRSVSGAVASYQPIIIEVV